jgi:hypothetical protein
MLRAACCKARSTARCVLQGKVRCVPWPLHTCCAPSATKASTVLQAQLQHLQLSSWFFVLHAM